MEKKNVKKIELKEEELSKVVGGSRTDAGYLGQGIFQFIFGKGKHR